jgi:GxxExxY protein
LEIRELILGLEEVAKLIVEGAIKVHRALGPGLLESAYQECLAYELRKHGLRVDCEVSLPLMYDGLRIDAGYRVDMIVEKCILIENKTVNHLAPIHEAQLLTHLKLQDYRIGFLLNWNVVLMKNGIKCLVNNLEEPPRRQERKELPENSWRPSRLSGKNQNFRKEIL